MDANNIENSVPSPHVEIIHSDNYDILINARHPNQERLHKLAQEFKNGLPTNWDPLPNQRARFNELGTPALFCDNINKPKYFAKIKRNGTPKELAQELSVRGADPSKKRMLQAFNSLVNEFVMSLTIRELLNGPETQRIAEKYGFARIELIEPLVGVNDRENNRKIMVYDFVTADEPYDKPLAGKTNKVRQLAYQVSRDRNTDMLSQVVDELAEVFTRYGVIPTDLVNRQIMSSKDDGSGTFTLYLFDIEGYYKFNR